MKSSSLFAKWTSSLKEMFFFLIGITEENVRYEPIAETIISYRV